MIQAEPRILLDLAVRIAEEAGALLAQRLAGERSVAAKSTPTDVVTEVDRESEALIVGRLVNARPDDAILGEEGTARPGTSGVRWVIDPLDGTVNYLYRAHAFAVSIAAEMDGRAVAGVVRDASRGETFAAALGYGAMRDGHPIRVSEATDLAYSLVGTGFGYDPRVRALQGATVARLLPRVRDIRRHGSAALDLCWVACGRLDAYYERGVQPWDVAAGALIVQEAGGRAEPLDDASDLVGPTWVAGGPGVFEALRELVSTADAE